MEEWRSKPALTEAVIRAFVFADASAEVDHAAAVIEHLLGLAIAPAGNRTLNSTGSPR